MFEISKSDQYQTRDGRNVKLFATVIDDKLFLANNQNYLIGAVLNPDGSIAYPCIWNANDGNRWSGKWEDSLIVRESESERIFNRLSTGEQNIIRAIVKSDISSLRKTGVIRTLQPSLTTTQVVNLKAYLEGTDSNA